MLQLCTLQLETLDLQPTWTQDKLDGPANHQRHFTSQIFYSNNRATLSVATNIGKRDHNLDKFDYLTADNFELIALYDGHGNSTVSNYLQTYLLNTLKSHPFLLTDFETAISETFQMMETQILNLTRHSPLNTGSTAIVLLVTRNQFYVANLGDSRAISINRQGSFSQINTEHNLSNEDERQMLVERGGVLIRRGKYYRLSGEINVSRSFGDFKHKPAISCMAQIKRFSREDTKYIIIGSDGFWSQTCNDNVSSQVFQQSGNKAKMLMQDLCKKPLDNSTVICYEVA